MTHYIVLTTGQGTLHQATSGGTHAAQAIKLAKDAVYGFGAARALVIEVRDDYKSGVVYDTEACPACGGAGWVFIPPDDTAPCYCSAKDDAWMVAETATDCPACNPRPQHIDVDGIPF